MEFIPDDNKQADEVIVPFLEDARADFAPFYSSNKTIKQATAELEKEMAKLGASVLRVQSGKFSVNGKTRLGYLIEFSLYGVKGQLTVAALPIRKPTPTKENQARVQALLNVVQWIQSMVTKRVFSPGANPLIPYLLAADGRQILETLATSALLQLTAPQSDIVEAEIEDKR
jgi:hypothetical protein